MAQRKEPLASLSSSSDPLLLQHSPPFDQTFLFRDTFETYFASFVCTCTYIFVSMCTGLFALLWKFTTNQAASATDSVVWVVSMLLRVKGST